MEVPEGWTKTNKPGAEESLSWTIVSRLNNLQVGVSLYARAAGSTSDSFHISVDGVKRPLIHGYSYWRWSAPITFTLAKAGKHTLKILLNEDGSKVSAVKLLPAKNADTYPVWFAQTDPGTFLTGTLSHDKSGKCMVRAQHLWAHIISVTGFEFRLGCKYSLWFGRLFGDYVTL